MKYKGLLTLGMFCAEPDFGSPLRFHRDLKVVITGETQWPLLFLQWIAESLNSPWTLSNQIALCSQLFFCVHVNQSSLFETIKPVFVHY